MSKEKERDDEHDLCANDELDQDATASNVTRPTRGFSENDMPLLKMVISNDLSNSNSSLSDHHTQVPGNDTSVSNFSPSEEMKQGMQLVLTHEAAEFSGMADNSMIIQDAVNAEDIDAQVVYLNPDGTIVFDNAGFSTASTEHGSSILEPSARYMLSTTLQGNVILSSNDAHSSGITIGPHTQLAFKHGDLGEGSAKFCNLSDYAQQTLTMVIDNSSALGQEFILVEPGSFGDGQTLGSEDAKNTEGNFPSMKSSLLDVPDSVGSHTQTSTILHKANNELATYSVQLQPSQCHSQTGYMSSSDQVITGEILGLEYAQISEQDDQLKNDVLSMEDDSLTEKQKAERRHLEKSHLEHHLKLTQRKLSESRHHRSEFQHNFNPHDNDRELEESIEALEKVGINDETPIFSSISAKINASLLNLVPGCHHFLLEQAQNLEDNPSGITFQSETHCTFNGSLNALLNLHNELKRILKLRQRTVLSTKIEIRGQCKEEKGISCELLRPYISARGRKPKCSLKASQMGFVTSLENYLSTDGIWSIGDEKTDGRGRRHLYSNRRKRGRPRKYLHNEEKRFKAKTIDSNETVSIVPNEVISPDKGAGVKHKSPQEAPADTPLALDPVQARLLEEQAKYRKAMDAKKEENSVCNEVLLPEDELNSGEGSKVLETQDDRESGEENPLLTGDCSLVAKRRGRPCKKYEPNLLVEKVLPRNPLTESAATKQQRNYEEHLAFKFFCSQCSFKTKRQSHFQSHLKCHKDGTEKKYSCSHCDFVTISMPMFKRHELKHKENLFSCEICGVYTTDAKKLLHRHMRLKHSTDPTAEEKLACQQCSFSCFHPKEMARHQAGHERLPQTFNSCSHCKKNFRSRMHLQRHIRDVHGPEIRPHLCDTCGKAFKRTDALQQHKLVHISRTARSLPYKCPTCDKGFRSQAHLKEHSSMHSSERPFLCQYCGAAFKTQPVQRKHIMTLHIQPKNHICSVCCRQFNTKYALHRHEATHKAETEPATAAAAILIIESENDMSDKPSGLEDKNTLSTLDGYPTSLEADSISVDNQVSKCLVQDIIGSAATVIETPLELTGQNLGQTFIQGNQDGTLYYFTGELPTL